MEWFEETYINNVTTDLSEFTHSKLLKKIEKELTQIKKMLGKISGAGWPSLLAWSKKRAPTNAGFAQLLETVSMTLKEVGERRRFYEKHASVVTSKGG